MNLEYFEHDIFEMPSAKDLLKYIIKRLNRTNDKIKFLYFSLFPRLQTSTSRDVNS